MTEQYKPTPEEKQRLKVKPDALKISGDSVFATLQGEGMTAGMPAVFLRLHLCNLACGDAHGWKCDTAYTWDRKRPEFWQEPTDWTIAQTTEHIQTSWQEKFQDDTAKRLVITGGEPLLQQKKIVQLLPNLPDWEIEIETNGTIQPLPELANCQFNCSPKLANSGNPLEKRYKPQVLRTINSYEKSQFKFVANALTDINEIAEIAAACDLSPEKIFVMPEGHTIDIVQNHASILATEVAKNGWNIAMRNQLLWFGPKRRT